MPGLMRTVRRLAPGMRIEVVQKTILSIEEIVDGTADLSLGLMPTTLPKHCVMQTLYEDEYVCVMHKDHPLAGSELTVEAYLDYPHAVIHTGKVPGSFVDSMLAKHGLSRRIVKFSPHFVASVLSIRDTDLLHTAPRRLAEPMLEAAGLVMRELPIKLEPVVLSQLWHARHTLDPLHRWFREQVALVARGGAADG